MNKSPCSSRCWPSGLAAGKRPLLHGIFFFSLFSNPPGVYKPPAVPSGAAQGAHYPAGTVTRGDIIFKLSLPVRPELTGSKSESQVRVRGQAEPSTAPFSLGPVGVGWIPSWY